MNGLCFPLAPKCAAFFQIVLLALVLFCWQLSSHLSKASDFYSDNDGLVGRTEDLESGATRCAMAGFGVIYTRSTLRATTVAIGKATNVAIDDTILDRIKAVMPSYHSQKAFINQLLDEAVTLREELTTRIKKSVAE